MEKKYLKLSFKYLTVTFIIFLIKINISNAQTSGYGCLVSSTIYRQYLGEGYPYGRGSQKMKYYKSNGTFVVLNYNNYNNTKPNNYNYECNKVNVFGASSSGPAQQEYVSQNISCVIATNLDGSVSGNGTYVYYSYNNPNYCSGSQPVQAPIDNGYIWILIFAVGGIGAYLISKKGQLI